MVKVAGIWERGWMAPMTEADLWQFVLRDYGVDEWIMAPISGVTNKRVKEYDSISEAIAQNPHLDVVFVDERGSTNLTHFTHPKDALYVLGRAGYSAMQQELGSSVYVPTPFSGGLLWPHQAISIVLHDRFLKNGSDSL